MASPAGWQLTKVDGTRKAINPEGKIVAYNQYLNAQARQSGFKSHSDYRRYASKIAGYRTNENRSKLELGSSTLKEFKEVVIDRKRSTRSDRRAGGRLARILEELGVRPAGAAYPVGDTPGE